jgi:AcrR family transcriptional regulator
MAKATTKPGRKGASDQAPAHSAEAEAEPGSVTSRILAEATRLFAEKGFLGTSVQEIVDAANVTKGALYYYYSSKDDLLYEIYHRVIEKELAMLDRVLAMNLSPADTVDALMTDIVITTAAHRDDVVIFQREMHRLSPEKLRAVRSDRRRYHVAFRGVIEKGQSDGSFRSDVSAELVTIGFFGLVHHYYTWYREDARFSAQYMARESSRWFLESLQPTTDAAPKRRGRSTSNGAAPSARRSRSAT